MVLNDTLVGILGPSTDATRRVLDVLVDVHDFRVHDMCEPAKDALFALDPLLCGEKSLRELVTDLGWDATLAHRLHGPEATRLLHATRFDLPGTVLPDSVWVQHVQASILAATSLLGPGPVVVHDLRPGREVDWLRAAGGHLWQVDDGTGGPAPACVLDTSVSDTALGRRVERELAALRRVRKEEA